MYKSYSMELAGRTLTVDVDRVCAQSNGAALMHYGDTTVLSTCTASAKPRDGIDFFPLSVEYEEKMYSVGKFPGFTTNSPPTIPIWVVAQGPSKGTSERQVDREEPSIAKSSGEAS